MTAIYIITVLAAAITWTSVTINNERKAARRRVRTGKARALQTARQIEFKRLRWSVYTQRNKECKSNKRIRLVCKNPNLQEVFKCEVL